MNAFTNDWFPGRTFEVYAIASDKALSKPTTFNAAYNEMERMGNANGASNGMDVREVK